MDSGRCSGKCSLMTFCERFPLAASVLRFLVKPPLCICFPLGSCLGSGEALISKWLSATHRGQVTLRMRKEES